jgi:DNA-binding transcriptional LysR family regulator
VVKLSGIDLNLVVVLQALLEERNVTHAGERVCLSQPATSAALMRLRRHFRDDLLVRVGNAYELTPLAQQLLEPVSQAVAFAERAFAVPPEFDPLTTEREFSMVASDYAVAVLSEHLMPLAQVQAPRMRLRLAPVTLRAIDDLEQTLRSADVLLIPRGTVSNYPGEDLYHDTWVCLVWSKNTEVGDRLTVEDLRRLGWVVIYQRSNALLAPELQLKLHGIERRAEVVAESFLLAPLLVTGTERVCMVQARLAQRMQPMADVRVVPGPFEIADLDEAMWWHPIRSSDQGHRWLRGLLREAASHLTP